MYCLSTTILKTVACGTHAYIHIKIPKPLSRFCNALNKAAQAMMFATYLPLTNNNRSSGRCFKNTYTRIRLSIYPSNASQHLPNPRFQEHTAPTPDSPAHLLNTPHPRIASTYFLTTQKKERSPRWPKPNKARRSSGYWTTCFKKKEARKKNRTFLWRKKGDEFV